MTSNPETASELQSSFGISAELFRAVMSSFPTGVTVVTVRDTAGDLRGLTSNAVCSVSLEPPLLLFCLDRRSETLNCLRRSRAFVVNFLAEGKQELANHFARRGIDKFSGVSWRPSEVAGGAPILVEGTVAYAECLVFQIIEVGDHFVVVGEIKAGSANGGVPLVYLRREYLVVPKSPS